jgi:hypothetical protein
MFCTTIKGKLKSLLRQFDNYVDTHIDRALAVTTGLKNMLSSPVADIITAVIPGDLDSVIRRQLIAALSKAVEALLIAENCRHYADLNDKLSCFIEQLKLRDPLLQDALLHKLASLLTSRLDGQRMKQSLYDLYTQAKYTAAK